MFILLAKYQIFHAKTNNGSPLIKVFVRTVKERFAVEKHNNNNNNKSLPKKKEKGKKVKSPLSM